MGEHHSLREIVVSGRECGGCTACCKTLRIAELKKFAGVLCQHCTEGAGCQIYDDRPSVCRGYNCGWKRLQFLGDEWRPDRCGILIGLVEKGEGIPAGFPPAGLKFDIMDSPRVLNWYPLVGLISREIERKTHLWHAHGGAFGGRVSMTFQKSDGDNRVPPAKNGGVRWASITASGSSW